MTRVVSLLKDDIYQLLEIKNDPYDRVVIHQGTLPEVEAKQAINQLINQARIDELKELLADDGQCVCQLANQEVCDHNWSLCNTVKDRLKELKGE